MSPVDLIVVRAFTQDGAGGNPAGVVLDADGLSDAEKQAAAASAGFPETAFVSRSEVATLKLDFFTPVRRIAHCGHATIAVFAHLNATGVLADGLHSKETIDGVRAVRVEGGRAAMQQAAPRISPVDGAVALDALGLKVRDVEVGFEPVCVDTGNRFLLVGVWSAARLAEVTPDAEALERLSEALDLIGAYIFTLEAATGYAASARMFAPRYGIPEEAATGMAAGPLGALLHLRGRVGLECAIEQGRYMNVPSLSRLEVRLEAGPQEAVAGIWVAGTAAIGRA